MEPTFSLRLYATHRQGTVSMHGVWGGAQNTACRSRTVFVCLFMLSSCGCPLSSPLSAKSHSSFKAQFQFCLSYQVFYDCASWGYPRDCVVQDLVVVFMLELVSQLAQGRHYTHLIRWGPCSPNKVLKIVRARGVMGPFTRTNILLLSKCS